MHGFKARIIQALRRASEKTLPRLLKYAHAYEFLNGGVLSPKKNNFREKRIVATHANPRSLGNITQ